MLILLGILIFLILPVLGLQFIRSWRAIELTQPVILSVAMPKPLPSVTNTYVFPTLLNLIPTTTEQIQLPFMTPIVSQQFTVYAKAQTYFNGYELWQVLANVGFNLVDNIFHYNFAPIQLIFSPMPASMADIGAWQVQQLILYADPSHHTLTASLAQQLTEALCAEVIL